MPIARPSGEIPPGVLTPYTGYPMVGLEVSKSPNETTREVTLPRPSAADAKVADKARLTIYLDQQLIRRLRRERADHPGTSVSEIVETVIRARYDEMDRRGRKARA